VTHAVVSGYKWIDAILRPDTQLQSYVSGRLYTDVAPPTTATPYVITSLQGGIDLNTANAVRIWTDSLWQVKAVAPATDSVKQEQAASRLDALLTAKTVVAGFTVSCWREQTLYYSETINGVVWRHLGGIYRLLIEPTP
jgi:hypothetical protein